MFFSVTILVTNMIITIAIHSSRGAISISAACASAPNGEACEDEPTLSFFLGGSGGSGFRV